MRRLLRTAIMALAGLLAGCGGAGAAVEPTPLPAATVDQRVIAQAKVVPAAFVELSFAGVERVAELLVAEGDQVRAGQALARLDTRELAQRVRQAEAAHAQALAAYEDLRAGASPEELAAAEARLREAEAAYAQAHGSVTPADITAARAAVAEAEARLGQLQSGPKDTELASAQAALDRASAARDAQRDTLSLTKTDAGRAVEQAANRLRNAQDAYSRTYWDNRELAGRVEELPQAALDAEAAALRAVLDGESALAQARAAYDHAVQAERDGIAAAEADVAQAQAGVNQIAAGADADQIAAAHAQLARAQADLAKLLGEQRAGSLAGAAAAIESAQADLGVVSAGPRDTALAVAQARIQSAVADVELARVQLEQATLTAPLGGSVAELNLKIGEPPPRDGPALVIADFSGWQIETEDLTEFNVVRVREGDPAEITFDAIRDLTLPGEVTTIKPIGKDRQGDIVYTVVVRPGRWDARLRWNMTASVKLGA